MMRLKVLCAGLLSTLPLAVICHKPLPSGSLYLVIDKTDNTVTLFDTVDWLIQWPCTFGSQDLGDKMFEGDRRTPEGRYKITRKYPHQKWARFLRIDYPTRADYEKFNQRKQQGLIPKNARIGGDIGIHGTWPREDWAVENLQPWTLGCISMKNADVNELYSMVPVGTPVIIRK